MTISMGVTSVGETTAVLSLAGYGSGASIDLQLSSRSDFMFAVSPRYSIPLAGSYSAFGLNQDATYFARSRTRFADGTVEPWSDPIGFRTTAGAARDTSPKTIMVEPAILAFPHPILSATSAQTIAGYPAENVGVASPVAWRAQSPNANPNYATIDILTPGEPTDLLAILMTNMPEAGFITLQAGDSTSSLTQVLGNTPFRATPNLPGRAGFHGLFRFPSRSARVWRLTLAVPQGAGPTGGFFHVEHVILARALVSKNVSGDRTETSVGLTTTERTRSGVLDKVPGLPMRRGEADLANLTEQQFEATYGQLWRRQGDAALFVPNAKAGGFLHDRILFGEFGAGRATWVQGIRTSRSFVVDSII